MMCKGREGDENILIKLESYCCCCVRRKLYLFALNVWFTESVVVVVTAGIDTEGIRLGLLQIVAGWSWGLELRALAAAPRSAGVSAVVGLYGLAQKAEG